MSQSSQSRETEQNPQVIRQAMQYPLEQTVQFQKGATQLFLNGLELSNWAQSRGMRLTRQLFTNYIRTLEETVQETESMTQQGFQTMQEAGRAGEQFGRQAARLGQSGMGAQPPAQPPQRDFAQQQQPPTQGDFARQHQSPQGGFGQQPQTQRQPATQAPQGGYPRPVQQGAQPQEGYAQPTQAEGRGAPGGTQEPPASTAAEGAGRQQPTAQQESSTGQMGGQEETQRERETQPASTQ